MTYELLKQLKDAGFPQNNHYYCRQDGIISDVSIPTLSELIEVCGGNFYSLYRHKKDKWQAHSNSDQWDTEITDGSTPEEAVAKLWLEVNKK